MLADERELRNITKAFSLGLFYESFVECRCFLVHTQINNESVKKKISKTAVTTIKTINW